MVFRADAVTPAAGPSPDPETWALVPTPSPGLGGGPAGLGED